MPTRLLLVAVVAAISGGAAAMERSPAGGRIDRLLRDLQSRDGSVVERAAKELERVAQEGLAAGEAERLLRAAPGSFAKRKLEAQSTPADLVRAAARRPAKALVPVVAEVFPRLPSVAQTEALQLLMAVEDRSGAETLVRLVGDLRAAGKPIPELRTAVLRKSMRHADVYFPALLDVATDANRFDVYATFLSALEAGALDPQRVARESRRVLAAWAPVRDAARAAQARGGAEWTWQEDYQEVRETAGLLLDVLGYFPTRPVRIELHDALAMRDPKLRCFAAASLLRVGERVAPAAMEEIAAGPEQRNVLYGLLERLDKASLFPSRWRTQEAFAESEMVVWLVYPTELGRPPHEIELMRVISEDLGSSRGGVHDWYLFRFRTREPHWAAKNGWMAGIAGPFRRSDAPSPTAHGDTFSQFEKWDSKTPDEHVRAVREQVEKAWKKRAER